MILETGAQKADEEIESVLKAQWAQAGIQTSIGFGTLPSVVQDFRAGKWQAFLQQAGGFSPGLGVGLTFRFESTGPYRGIDDPALDGLIKSAAEQVTSSAMEKAYRETFSYIAAHAYAPFLYVAPQYDLTTKSVSAPGLTTNQYEIFGEDASVR